MKSRLRLLLPTLWRLGPFSVASVAGYRLACRLGAYRRLLPVGEWQPEGAFFAPAPALPPALRAEASRSLLERADALLEGELAYFSCLHGQVGNPPDWFLDPFSGARLDARGHWSALDEFGAGDIKKVWEASRFEWAPLLARAWRLSGRSLYLDTLNGWLADWVRENPFNAGANWKCGQEASIRLINLLLAARLTGCDKSPSAALQRLVALHCARILPTIRYAVAQNNNHGTSEAAALFIGGAWLAARGGEGGAGSARRWRDAGRRWLEDRVATLVAGDGSFAQYSVNYHRVLLDTLCQVELWRRALDQPGFSAGFAARCRGAVQWLAALTDPDSGDAPNLGANDGARLYDLSGSGYRDYRPSVQLGALLFLGRPAYPAGEWDLPLHWLGLAPSAPPAPPCPGSVLHREGGDLVLRGQDALGVIRFASFRFRPSHADCLHLDLWHRGRNILRDGGTYSYNTEARWLDYFSGTRSHNTVQFDGRDQMPRLGRFLFADWLKMSELSGIGEEDGTLSWSGAYRDAKGGWHRRTVRVTGKIWRVMDEIGGFRDRAVLRWRLIPGEWQLKGDLCDSPLASLRLSSDAPLRRLELTTGWESLHYQEKSELPVLEAEAGPETRRIETEITLKD